MLTVDEKKWVLKLLQAPDEIKQIYWGISQLFSHEDDSWVKEF